MAAIAKDEHIPPCDTTPKPVPTEEIPFFPPGKYVTVIGDVLFVSHAGDLWE